MINAFISVLSFLKNGFMKIIGLFINLFSYNIFIGAAVILTSFTLIGTGIGFLKKKLKPSI